MRAFISIEIPEEVKDYIVKIQKTIQQTNLIKAKFTGKDNIHLTLKFLGEIVEKEVPMIIDVLKTIKFSSFTTQTSNLGFFWR